MIVKLGSVFVGTFVFPGKRLTVTGISERQTEAGMVQNIIRFTVEDYLYSRKDDYHMMSKNSFLQEAGPLKEYDARNRYLKIITKVLY